MINQFENEQSNPRFPLASVVSVVCVFQLKALLLQVGFYNRQGIPHEFSVVVVAAAAAAVVVVVVVV